MSAENKCDENTFIMELEKEIAKREFESASRDIKTYLSVTKSLNGLLEHEKAAKHLQDFVVDERCEENYSFMLEVNDFRRIHADEKYTVKQKIQKAAGVVDMFLGKDAVYQLYINPAVINEFMEEYKQWNKEVTNPTEKDVPPVTLFDKLVLVVKEMIDKTSYQKFIRTPNIDRKLAMTVQDITISEKTETSLPKNDAAAQPMIELYSSLFEPNRRDNITK